MQQLVSRFRRQLQSLQAAQGSSSKISLLGGILFVGWLGGALIPGFLSHPTSLSAAIPANTLSHDIVQPHKTGFSEVAKNVRPAVVHITVVHDQKKNRFEGSPSFDGPDFFESPFPVPPKRDPRGMGMGSGVIISPEGHVVTNNHVVEGASRVTVTLLDKRKFAGQVIGLDPKTDLALVKIDGTNLPYLKWGDSARLQVGEYVLAVGTPFGLTATVTQGIVSGLGRGGMGITQYEDFIQTDAAINPGNSGGALVNAKGELVGINTAIFSRTGGYQGIGFAVPSGMAKSVYASLLENGKVIRGYLGVGIQELTPELADTFQLDNSKGALVTDVKPGSPADQAGVKRGDTVVEYQKVPIDSPRALQREVMTTPVGSSVSITVVRDGEKKTVKAAIVEQTNTVQLAKAETRKHDRHLSGLSVEELDSMTAKRLGVDHGSKGVVVTNVQPGSSADRAGLARGDVIREVNKKAISSIDDYERIAASLPEGQAALLLIERRGAPLFLSMMV